MKKNKQITPDEVKAIQLDMLKEIDDFCRKNNIRYSLSYGTLLGAIRHKGYIPWDDDVDLIMPEPDLLKFKQLFISDNLKYVDVDTEPYYTLSFPRICYNATYSKTGLISTSYGVSIDLYPVVGLPDDKDLIEKYLQGGTKLRIRRQNAQKWRQRVIRFVPLKSIPFFKQIIKKATDYVYQFPYDDSKYYYHHGGPFKWYEVFDFDVFSEMIEVDFEGFRFCSLARYDDYLRQIYGDYMQLPPEENRHPYHQHSIYWK